MVDQGLCTKFFLVFLIHIIMILTIYFKYMETLSQNSYLYMIAHMIAWSDEVADCHRVWKLFSETTLTWPFFLKSRPEIDRDLSDIGLFPLLDLEKSSM